MVCTFLPSVYTCSSPFPAKFFRGREIVSDAVEWLSWQHWGLLWTLRVWDTVLWLFLFCLLMLEVKWAIWSTSCSSPTLKAVQHRFWKVRTNISFIFWILQTNQKRVTCSRPADCGWGSIPMPLTVISVMNWLSSGNQSRDFCEPGWCVCARPRPPSWQSGPSIIWQSPHLVRPAVMSLLIAGL